MKSNELDRNSSIQQTPPINCKKNIKFIAKFGLFIVSQFGTNLAEFSDSGEIRRNFGPIKSQKTYQIQLELIEKNVLIENLTEFTPFSDCNTRLSESQFLLFLYYPRILSNSGTPKIFSHRFFYNHKKRPFFLFSS